MNDLADNGRAVPRRLFGTHVFFSVWRGTNKKKETTRTEKRKQGSASMVWSEIDNQQCPYRRTIHFTVYSIWARWTADGPLCTFKGAAYSLLFFFFFFTADLPLSQGPRMERATRQHDGSASHGSASRWPQYGTRLRDGYKPDSRNSARANFVLQLPLDGPKSEQKPFGKDPSLSETGRGGRGGGEGECDEASSPSSSSS